MKLITTNIVYHYTIWFLSPLLIDVIASTFSSYIDISSMARLTCNITFLNHHSSIFDSIGSTVGRFCSIVVYTLKSGSSEGILFL